MWTLKFTALLIATLLGTSLALASGVTYQGRIVKPDGQPLAGTNVQFRMQIRSPNANNCLMYEELQTRDMHDANGIFSLTINDGTGSRQDSSGLAFDRVFSNFGSLTFASPTCLPSGNTYAPADGDGRQLVVLFKDETMGSWEPIPAAKINYVPFAFSAQNVQGFAADSLLRVVGSGGDPLTGVSPLSNTQYSELLLLLAGTSAQYTHAGQLAGSAVPAMTSGQVLGWNGTTWTSTDPLAGVQTFAKTALPTCASNNFLRNNGSGVLECIAPAVGGGGTVTQVNTGTGLTGGGFTTTGTISIAAQGVDTAQLKDGGVTLVKLAADSVNSSKIVDGSIAGADLNSAINITTSGTVATGVSTTRDFKLYPASGSFKINFAAPTLAADYTLTFPVDDGTPNQVLTTDGSGVLTWSTPSGTGLTALTGDVTASGTGSVPATVTLVGGSTAALVHTAELAANAAASANTASTIVKRDASGNFTAGVVTSASNATGTVVLKDSGANTVTVQAPGTVSTSYILKLPTAAAVGTQVLQSDAAGNSSWASMPTALPPNGAAGGDLSGTYPSPTVATVGASTAALVHTAELAANAAASANTASTIVKRDGSGAFAAGVVTADGVTLKNAGSLLNIVNPVGGAWTMTLPATAGSSGQVLTTNGAGVLSWAAAGGAGGFVNGGNTFGAASSLGNTDNFDLNIKTNNLNRMTVTAGGSVGIGTTVPAGTLDVQGGTAVASTIGAPINFAAQNGGSGGAQGGNINLNPGAGTLGFPSGSVNIGASSNQALLAITRNGTDGYTPTGVVSQPISTLSLRNTYTINSNSSLISFGASNSSVQQGAYFGGVSTPSATNNGLAFVWGQRTGTSSYSERMRMDSDGNVGIGTTAPATRLQVGGSFLVGDGGETCGATFAGAIRYSGGNLQFCNGTPPWSTLGVAGAGITALTGDVTASGTGSVAATIANVGGSTAAAVNTATVLANAATNLNTATTIVKRDASGNFVAGTITAASNITSSVVLKDTGSNTVTLQAPATVGTSYTLKMPTAVSGSTQLLQTDATGQLSYVAMPFALPPNGAAGGDLSGTYPNPTVGTVGTSTAAQVHTAELLANAATDANINSAIVKRDSSGNFSTNVATANGFTLKNAGSLLNIVSPIGGAWTMTLPATAGSSNQVLTTDGSGLLSWTTPSGGSLTNFTESVTSSAPNATVPVVRLLANNTATNVDIALSPKGTGALTAQVADGSSSGGNKRGTGAVDWQLSRSSATAVASGSNSVISGGSDNTASGTWAAVSSGVTNSATGTASFVAGGTTNTASGSVSLAANYVTTAEAFAQTTIGAYNLPKGSENPLTWIATDPLFVIGNGTASGASRSTAVMVLKNGNVGIGTTAPTNSFEIDSTINTQGAVINRLTATAGDYTGLYLGATTVPTTNLKSGLFFKRTTFGNGVGDLILANRNVGDAANVSPTDAVLTIHNASVGIGTTVPNGGLDVVDPSGIAARNYGTNSGGVFKGYAARGTEASPTATQIDDVLFQIGGLGYRTGGFSSTSVVGVRGVAAQNFTSSAQGTYLQFLTTPTGATSANERMRIDPGGNVGIGTSSPNGKLDVKGSIVMSGATSGYTGFQPPAAAGSTVWTLPASDGSNGQMLSTNGTGTLSWTTPSGGGISALTGDVTASGSGSVAATVANVGGVTAANVATGANLANAATNANTASTIVKRDASGNFAAGNITQAQSIFTPAFGPSITLQAPSSVTTAYSIKLPAAVASVSGQVLASDTSGVTSWYTLPTALPPNGTAGGDLSGTYPNPTVAKVGTSTAANIHAAELLANAATSANTASTIVKRDASGAFAAGVVTTDGVALMNAGSLLNIVNPIGGAWTMTLPGTAGSTNQVLTTNGSGVTSWTTPTTSPWAVQAPGINYLGGNVGIGTTSPLSSLTISKAGAGAGGQMDITGTGQQSLLIWTTDAAASQSQASVFYQTPAGATLTGMTAVPGRLMTTSVANEFVFNNRAGPIGFSTDSAYTRHDLFITPAGNIGVGTTSPISKLDVRGAIGVINDDWVTGSTGSGLSVQMGTPSGNTRAEIQAVTFGGTAMGNLALQPIGGNVGIGTTSPTQTLEVNGTVLASAYLYSSDRRLKKDITPLEESLDKLLTLNTVKFNWITPKNKDEERQQIGLIAQDVQKVFPEAVTVDSQGWLRMNYQALISPIIDGMRELYTKVLGIDARTKALESQVATLKAENDQMKDRLSKIEQALTRLPASDKPGPKQNK